MRFISSSLTLSSSFYARQSGSESGSLVSSSYIINVIKDIGSLEPDFVNSQIEFIIPSQSAGGANDVKALTISASGNNPRIGIGTNDPKGVFDFKDVEDTATGAELLLRSARSTQGALTGDGGGAINFVIDSGSFNDLKTSGSLAKIKTQVNSIGTGGAQGKLIFELSKAAGGQSIDAFEYGYGIGGRSLMTSVQTASLIITDLNSAGTSILEMRDSTEGSRFSVEEGNVEISGSLGVTGSATFNSGITSTALTFTSLPVQGSEGTSLMINGGGVVGTRELGTIAFFQGDQNLRQADNPTFANITSSGNISASGDITVNNINGNINGGSF